MIKRKGMPGRPGFHGQVQRITSYLGEGFTIGSVSAASVDAGSVPVIAHWRAPRSDGSGYLVMTSLAMEEGRWKPLEGTAVCTAQQENRVLGLLRFETSPGLPEGPRGAKACIAFRFSADHGSEVLAPGVRGAGGLQLENGLVVRVHGYLAGVRILRIRVPGAGVTTDYDSAPAPFGPRQGESGLHLTLSPLAVTPGKPAYVAFAIEVEEESRNGGLSGMMRRLRSARVIEESSAEGRVRLAWGSSLSLTTSTRTMPRGSWLAREGAAV